MCTFVYTAEKDRVPLCRGLCLRVIAGDGESEWLTGVGETLITCNEIPEMTLQKGNSKYPTLTVSHYMRTLIRLHLKTK